MSLIPEVVRAHRARIVAEVEAVVWHDNPALHRLGRVSLVGVLERLLDALTGQVSQIDSVQLPRLLGDLTRQGKIPAPVLNGALVRLAAALRAVLLLEVDHRRAMAIASAALDRAVAEATESVRELPRAAPPPSDDPPPSPPAAVPAPGFGREPTVIRNIREVLASAGVATQTATIIAIAVRDDPGAGAESTPTARADCLAAFAAAGAELAVDHPALLAASFAARVDDTDVAEALDLALGLTRRPELSTAGFGLARGLLRVTGADQASGPGLDRAIGLAEVAKPGVVLTDEALEKVAGRTFALRSVSAAVPAFRLDPEQPQWLDRWEQAALVNEPELCGQRAPLKRLRSQLRSPGRKVALIRLRGRPGSGRFRLLGAALADLGIDEARVLVGEPHPLAAAPYWPVVTICRRLLGLADGPVQDHQLQQALDRLGAASASTAPLKGLAAPIGALLGTEETDEALLELVDPAAMRTQIATTFRLLVETAADAAPDRPLVVVVRDADAADPPTLHALAHLALAYQGAAQLVIALTYRGAFRPPAGLAEISTDEITLEPLARAEIDALVRSALDQEELPGDLLRLISDRAGGSPLLALTLTRLLVETGAIQRRDGRWERGAPVGAAELPKKIGDALAQRIRRLPHRLADLLKIAATVGEPLLWGALELAWVHRGWARDELERTVGLLAEIGFVQRDPGRGLRFTHPLVRAAAYHLQTADERRETHRLAAVAYRERYPNAHRQIPAVLLRHSIESHDPTGALTAAVHAVRRALLLHDHKRGLAIAGQALALADDGGPEASQARFDLLAARERLTDARGLRREQRADIKEMVALAERIGDERRLGVALHRAARLNLLAGDLPRARSIAGKALARLRLGDPLDLANGLRTLALIRWQERDPAEAAAALREAMQLYARLGHRRGVGYVLHSLGLFALDTGALEQARHHFEQALQVKIETDDQHGRAVVLDALGQVALLDRDQRAEAWLNEALALRQAAGDADGLAQTELNLGEALLGRDPARAESLARQAIKRCRTRRQGATKAEAHILLARTLLAQGNREAASRAAAAAARLSEGRGAQLLGLRARLVRAEVDLGYRSRKRLERAAQVAAEAAEIGLRAGAVRWRIEALSLLAETRARLADRTAHDVAREALALLEDHTAVGLDEPRVRARLQQALTAPPPGAPPG